MPNPWGTAFQVLAGAFGQGASSLGESRLEQERLDTRDRRVDDRNRQLDDLERQGIAAENKRASMAAEVQRQRIQADSEFRSEQLDVMGGLSPAVYQRVKALQAARGISYEQARLMVLTNDSDVSGTPIANPKPPARTRPAAPGLPGVGGPTLGIPGISVPGQAAPTQPVQTLPTSPMAADSARPPGRRRPGFNP